MNLKTESFQKETDTLYLLCSLAGFEKDNIIFLSVSFFFLRFGCWETQSQFSAHMNSTLIQIPDKIIFSL